MKINVDNYQEYAAEWLEGSLSAELNEAFNRFLAIHPEIADELNEIRETEGMQPDVTDDQNVDFSDLKRSVSDKTVSADNFLELVMARMDGELSDDAAIRLDNWLSQNPERKKEAEIFGLTILEPDMSVVYEEDQTLKQPVAISGGAINETRLEELIVAYIEGELSEDDQQKLNIYIQGNRTAEILFRQFAATKLTPDFGVICPGKANLKQKAVVPVFSLRRVLRVTAVAASLALLAGIFLFDRNEDLLITSPIESPLVKIPEPARPDPVLVAKAGESVTKHFGTVRASGRDKHFSAITNMPDDNSVQITTETGLSYDPDVILYKQALRETQSISPAGSQYPSLASHQVHFPATHTDALSQNPSERKLTINEFPIEQIRYFTGGGNENPGLLAELSIPRLIEITNPYERINSAGQQLITMWVQWKEKALDEVVPYR